MPMAILLFMESLLLSVIEEQVEVLVEGYEACECE
jgi:hypothetical protein